MRHFDADRREFTPYGFTCEIWEPMQMARPDRHDEIEINFVDRGTLTYLIGGHRVTVQPQNLTLFWAAMPHQIVAFNAVSFYYVVTVPFGWMLEWGLPASLLTPLTGGQIVAEPVRERAAADCQLFAGWQRDVQDQTPLKREIVLLELRARLLRLAQNLEKQKCFPASTSAAPPERPQTSHSKAEAMACYVARNYCQRIQIKDIAAHVQLHPDYAATLFRRTFGTTLNHFITRHRIAHAQRMLVTTDQQVLQIASAAGFESLSRFNRAFKQLAGMTPRQYRQTLGQHREDIPTITT